MSNLMARKGLNLGQCAKAADKLTPAQLRYLQSADRGAVKGWATPSIATLRSLVDRGLLYEKGGHRASDATVFYHLTEYAYRAIAKATGAA